MHFIIPKNYKIKPKILGLIDYQTAILDGFIAIILYILVNIFFDSISLKFYFFVGAFIPILLFSIIGIQNENIFTVFRYLLKYLMSQKIYLYRKK